MKKLIQLILTGIMIVTVSLIAQQNTNEAKAVSAVIKGGSSSYNHPYAQSELDGMMSAGKWNGGYVEGMGYVSVATSVYGTYTGK
jgi:hypothetical protein